MKVFFMPVFWLRLEDVMGQELEDLCGTFCFQASYQFQFLQSLGTVPVLQ